MSPDNPPPEFSVFTDLVDEHDCPICHTTIVNVYRPGRPRVYCTNACRQRAYRWRRAHGIRICVERNGPADQLMNRKLHALRDSRDPASTLRDLRERRLSACGVFAKPARTLRLRTHYQFVPESNNACETCISLIGVGPWGSGFPAVVPKALWEHDPPRW